MFIRFSWINNTQEQYSLEKAGDFVHEASITDYKSPNEKQKLIFNCIESHYNNILANNQVEPLRTLIMGTAASTGESYLIRAIQLWWI